MQYLSIDPTPSIATAAYISRWRKSRSRVAPTEKLVGAPEKPVQRRAGGHQSLCTAETLLREPQYIQLFGNFCTNEIRSPE